MGFSDKQLKALRRNLDHRCVRTRSPMAVSSPISRAGTRSRKPTASLALMPGAGRRLKSRCVLSRENRGAFLAVYTAKVRITVEADGMKIIREGHGSGEGRANSPGEVHDTALKAAETDATKRALATFGKPFGLELYRKDKKGMLEHSPTLQPATANSPSQPRVGLHPDDTTPIPRPSHYYGRRHQSSQ